MWILGIDPGFSGGLAVLEMDGRVIELRAIPDTEQAIFEAIRDLDEDAREASIVMRAVMEAVNARKGWHASGAFTFGRCVGALRVALAAHGIPCDSVSPETWMRGLGCLSGGDKRVTRQRAQALFPSVRGITHRTADALLLAEYARRQWAMVRRQEDES